MALTKEDKDEVRQIVRGELNPLERKMDAMMEILGPTLYMRHEVADLSHRIVRAEENIAELQKQAV